VQIVMVLDVLLVCSLYLFEEFSETPLVHNRQ
jgi:hypothetical protein